MTSSSWPRSNGFPDLDVSIKHPFLYFAFPLLLSFSSSHPVHIPNSAPTPLPGRAVLSARTRSPRSSLLDPLPSISVISITFHYICSPTVGPVTRVTSTAWRTLISARVVLGAGDALLAFPDQKCCLPFQAPLKASFLLPLPAGLGRQLFRAPCALPSAFGLVFSKCCWFTGLSWTKTRNW